MSRLAWALVALVAACGGDAPSSRARVLARLPANATTVFAAEGRALAHGRFRPVVDLLRAEVPAGWDCVVDAALAGEHVAGAIGPRGELVIALATRARVTCAQLSRIEDGLWVATLGLGAPAEGASVTSADAYARARPFLRDAPIAVASYQRDVRALATAQPDPLAAWVAFDAPDGAAAALLEAELQRLAAPYRALEATAAIAKALAIERAGSQVVVRLGPTSTDLAVAVRAVFEHVRAPAGTRAFGCPSLAPPVLGCEQRPCDSPLTCAVEHVRLEVYSLASGFDELLGAAKEPLIANGRVEGVRLRDDLATLGLQSGDVLVAIDGKRVTAVDQVAPYLAGAKVRASLIVGRSRRFATIELVEQ